MTLCAKDVTVKFGKYAVLSGVNMCLEAGTATAILGPNGAGKSTLLRVLAGVLAPSGGDVLGNATVYMTQQKPVLAPGLTLREHMALTAERPPLWRWLLPIGRGADARYKNALRPYGLDGRLGCKTGDLSFGQQRLFTLALAEVSGADVVLLDEPLAGVAEALHQTVARAITRLTEKCAVAFTEHDAAFAEKVAERVFTLKEGTLV